MPGIISGLIGGAGAALENIGGQIFKAEVDREARVEQRAGLRADREHESSLQADREKTKLLLQSQLKTAQQQAILNPGGGGVSPAGAGAAGATGAATDPLVAKVTAAAAAGGQVNASDLSALSRKYGIPEEALRTDLAYHDGKGISDMIFKAGRPDITVVNGVAIDRNRQQPGIVSGLNTSSDGKTTFVEAGPDGRPRVSMPPGAAETFGTYRGIEAGVKSANTPIKTYNPKTGREEWATEADVVNQPKPEAGVRGGFTGSPEAVSAQIANIKDPQERANARAAFEEQMKRDGGRLAAGPSSADTAKAAGDKVTAEQVAKDVAEQRKTIMNAGMNAPGMIARYTEIGRLLKDIDGGVLTARGTQLASALNSVGIKIDKNLPNKEAAAAMANEMALQLRNPSGGAGMPGAMSDADREFLVSMTPSAAQSTEGRKLLIDARVALAQRDQQVASFARRYEAKYGRLDNGFFEQLQGWSNENSMFKK